MKVAVAPLKPTVPFWGCETMRSVSESPSGSLVLRFRFLALPAKVKRLVSDTVAGRLRLR